MIGSRRQIKLTHRRPHQALTFRLERVKLLYLPDAYICHPQCRRFMAEAGCDCIKLDRGGGLG